MGRAEPRCAVDSRTQRRSVRPLAAALPLARAGCSFNLRSLQRSDETKDPVDTDGQAKQQPDESRDWRRIERAIDEVPGENPEPGAAQDVAQHLPGHGECPEQPRVIERVF